jgi:polyisoprenoid-binding protein YceI
MPRFRVIAEQSPVTIITTSTTHDTRAHADRLSGVLVCEFDERGHPRLDAPWSAELRLPVAAIKSGNPLQDRVMRGQVEAAKHPIISVKVTSARALRRAGHYRATAQITFHGRTRTVEGHVTVRTDGDHLLINGEQRFDMREFDIEPPRLLILRVDPVVVVSVHITARLER